MQFYYAINAGEGYFQAMETLLQENVYFSLNDITTDKSNFGCGTYGRCLVFRVRVGFPVWINLSTGKKGFLLINVATLRQGNRVRSSSWLANQYCFISGHRLYD